MKRINVRCCCNPELIYGTLPWNENGYRVRFNKLKPFKPYAQFNPNEDIEAIELEVDVCYVDGMKELAYRSNDIPIETFRLLPGFIEGERVYGVYDQR
jgi:hypothetical protein